MAKKQVPFDYLKLWPIAVVVVGGFTGYINLQNAQASDSKRIDKVESKQEDNDRTLQDLQIQQTQIQAKVDSGLEILRDLKESIKELKKS